MSSSATVSAIPWWSTSSSPSPFAVVGPAHGVTNPWRGATLTLSDGKSFGIELPDVRDLNCFEFNRPVRTGSIAIRVDSVYRGAKYADTAISELYPVFAD